MAESLCKGLCPLHPQPPLGTVEGFAPFPSTHCDDVRQSENAVKGLRVEISARKYYPSLDGVERHTALAEGKANSFPLLPHGECGAWGNAPQVKFRVGVRLPFSKGKEDWGTVVRRWGQSPLEKKDSLPKGQLFCKV